MKLSTLASLVPGERVSIPARQATGRVINKSVVPTGTNAFGRVLVKLHERTPNETALWFPAAAVEALS